jgi:hypothetical protein
MKWFWKKLSLFAYRRWRDGQGGDTCKPDGVPGNRDPDNPCTGYAPRKRQLGDWCDCATDGHYLCKECCHRDTSGNEPRALTWLQVSAVQEVRQ